ncbi:hypothetical protein BDQ12DRAFT_671560 [Crucibulum laeve]|uniref:Uncharacterized protein n=1 Tax=Crucibulum laeve TaxID=68775 RepID=A0A5C3LGE0_9AGAR|nr:hypothetical protein BDQ12DRAFT_671560 [Crucibulum laeve]
MGTYNFLLASDLCPLLVNKILLWLAFKQHSMEAHLLIPGTMLHYNFQNLPFKHDQHSKGASMKICLMLNVKLIEDEDLEPDILQQCFDVCIPDGCGNHRKDDPTMTTTITFDIDDIPPEDFLSCVCATMGVEWEKIQLGWKTCDEKKKEPPHWLQTHDNVKHAFSLHGKMLDSRQQEKPVWMDIFNMTKPVEAVKPVKSNETTTDPDVLNKVKSKLKCTQHPGPHQWCYIWCNEGHEGEHVPLGICEVGLWACMIVSS